ncbi:MAG: hypothetical protein H7281_13320, partial [Bacteriovorax sp.]|nr:hypothetical protein [Bacteriovorax sp.]
MKLIFILILNLFVFTTLLNAHECFQTTTKIIFNGAAESEKTILCKKKTSDGMLFYVSKTCLNDQCEILKRSPKKVVIKNYYANIGSPGFKLCMELGGTPQIFDFQDEKDKWKNTERCFFGKNDFVEISFLTREWKSFIESK